MKTLGLFLLVALSGAGACATTRYDALPKRDKARFEQWLVKERWNLCPYHHPSALEACEDRLRETYALERTSEEREEWLAAHRTGASRF